VQPSQYATCAQKDPENHIRLPQLFGAINGIVAIEQSREAPRIVATQMNSAKLIGAADGLRPSSSKHNSRS
jgi:hypothetical protein